MAHTLDSLACNLSTLQLSISIQLYHIMQAELENSAIWESTKCSLSWWASNFSFSLAWWAEAQTSHLPTKLKKDQTKTCLSEGQVGIQVFSSPVHIVWYQLYLFTERSMILNDALTGHNSQASFSRNMRSSSILDLWYVLKYFTVCVRMESWRSSDVLPQNSSPTAINLGKGQWNMWLCCVFFALPYVSK